MNPILFLLQILLFNIKPTRNEPVRLHKKQSSNKEFNINKDLELIAIAIFITITLVCLCLLFITSCTESGLIYNNHLMGLI